MKLKLWVVWTWMMVGVGFIYGADRVVLGELGTNTGCGPCYSANALLDRLRYKYWRDLALIRYHAWWPSSSDPFYVRNTSQNAARINYYGITGVPTFEVDGNETSNYEYAIQGRLSVPAPISIDLDFTRSKDTGGGTANVTIDVESPVSGDVRLFYVLVENDIYYEAPNGQRNFYEVMREMWPSENGQTVDLSTTGAHSFSQTIDFGNADDADRCYLVVFVQNYSTKEVYQAAKKCVADYYYVTYPPSLSAGTPNLDTTATFEFYIFNDGLNSETYTISAVPDVPAGWTVSTYTEAGAFSGSTARTLASEECETLRVVISSNGHGGYGTVKLAVSASHIASRVDTLTAAFSTGASVLLVDDDLGANYENWYIQALEDIGINFVHYNTSAKGTPSAAYMSNFDVVVWFTGDDYSSTLTSTDQSNLQTYLNGGGKLFLTGQDIGYDLTDDGSTSNSFYTNYLHAQYLNDDAGVAGVVGVSGDPIGDGLSFNILGGDGANNQNYPSIISPTGGSVPVFNYSGGSSCAAVRYDSGTFRVVYLAFGFEGIDNRADRDSVMARVLRWLAPDLGIGESAFCAPDAINIIATPNPFNSAVSIRLAPADIVRGAEILDLAGRVVCAFSDEEILSSGGRLVWKPGENVPAGIYLIRAVGERVTTSQVIFLK